jgi:hypothetical protein
MQKSLFAILLNILKITKLEVSFEEFKENLIGSIADINENLSTIIKKNKEIEKNNIGHHVYIYNNIIILKKNCLTKIHVGKKNEFNEKFPKMFHDDPEKNYQKYFFIVKLGDLKSEFPNIWNYNWTMYFPLLLFETLIRENYIFSLLITKKFYGYSNNLPGDALKILEFIKSKFN